MTQKEESVPITRVPALFEHVSTFYLAMEQESKTDTVNETGQKALIYEGYLTHLFKEQHLSMPYYSKITQKLKAMGCIEALRRGGSSAKSKWILHYPPDLEKFLATGDKVGKPKRQTRLDTLEQQMRDLTRRMNNQGF